MAFQFKKLYYYVQRCPECQSRVTGRFVKRPRYETDELYMQRASLKHGELVTFVDEELVNNCYCEDCGYQWRYEVIGRLISKERYLEEKQIRHTAERLAEFNELHPRKRKWWKAAFATLPRY